MTEDAHNYLKKILLSPVYDVAVKSDLSFLPKLSQELGNEIWLKREDQQPVKSFKLRGAYSRIAALSKAQQDAGVVTASAGNHAQGVAYAANKKGIHATIVMPETTPDIKVDAVVRFGGDYVTIVLHGTSFDQASAKSRELSQECGLTLVPPFDDPDVIAGQGTIARELLEQNPHVDTIFIAVGGGGLAAGMAVYIKQLKPEIKLIAVESEESACLQAALEAGEPVTLPKVGIFADGVAVKTIGTEPFRLCERYLDGLITVTNDEICTAIKDIFDDTRVIAEPAGAMSVAAIRKYVAENKVSGNVLGGVLCGANTNFHTLRYVSERCELGEQKEAIFGVPLPEKQGEFRRFCKALGGRIITEFNYRQSDANNANVFVGVKLKGGGDEYQQLLTSLENKDYSPVDLSKNELSKLHVRHMIGGKITNTETVFTFEFPEYPGALMAFLDTLGGQFNISLFHYRNHGAASGLVMVGFELKSAQREEFDHHLNSLGYRYEEVTDNPAYQMFLR
ncbi:threonine ammonia-lyase, biosynthetic [Alteromonas sp. 5E99-2]|uniref:threonine ammonia-lyase, biosynthetic n=1 Tax=Alteromonas sp. 5E99-2 TaxID=2817683 RepID=UPI001A997342|nr:threonine ammonia-lyase, biosynthetic [Alteromonas sp. 5E99-2]MBO1254796.1 threonine ammonia-lyase, biosynthetic [Alteromonas sp. 5E99-2]